MRKLIIEIPYDVDFTDEYNEVSSTAQLEEGDVECIKKIWQNASLYVEFGAPHSNQEYADMGIAECFALDVTKFFVRIEES